MTYDLIANGEQVDVDDRQYLLSPQDLSDLPVLPALIESGGACLKIEGRLKAPEYVANVPRVYRNALARVAEQFAETRTETPIYTPSADERYRLEMAFSRGLYTGWFEGIDNQALVAIACDAQGQIAQAES